MTVEQSQLVDQHRSQSETLSVDQSSGGNLPVHLEDGLEMLVEVLVSHAAQLVEDASDFDASIGVRVSSSFGGDQKPLGALACLPDVGRVVVDVSEHEAGFFWQLLDQVRGHLVVCRVSGGEPGTKRDPNLTDGDGQMQLPPVHPPVPAALGPVSLGVYGCVGYNACFLVFLVPHSTFCLQSGTVESHRSSPTLPGLEHFHQVASQTTDLFWELLGQSLQAPLEGALGRKVPSLRKQLTHFLHLLGVLLEYREQFAHFMQALDDHDHQCLQEQPLGVEDRSSARAAWRRWWDGDSVDQTDQLDKNTVLSDHGSASGSSVHGHTPSSEASHVRSSPDTASLNYDQASSNPPQSDSRGDGSGAGCGTSRPLHQGFVGLVEVVGDGDDGEDAGHQTRDGRGEDQSVGEERGDPLADAKVAGQELPQRPPQALAPGFLVHGLWALLLLELGERGAQGARDRILRQHHAQLVG